LSELALREGAPDDTRGILEAARQLLLTTFDLEGVLSADISAPDQFTEPLATLHTDKACGSFVIPQELARWFATIPTAAVTTAKDGDLPAFLAQFLSSQGAKPPLAWVVAIALKRRTGSLMAVMVAWKSDQGVRSYHRLPPKHHDLPFLQLLGRHLERAFENGTLVADLRRRGVELTEANQRLMASLENLDHTHRRLHEAQKMEALGRLAGGVAHDFNNLLCVILGNAGLLAESMSPSPELDDMRQIIDAAQRGRDISSQLLALGRRQPEGITPLELNDLLKSQTRFLSRLVGELHPVELELSDVPFWILGEKVLFERTVMNLVLNARDAMPNGGSIRIATRKALAEEIEPTFHSPRAENWVLLSVTDSGSGMDEMTRQRIFEPFFTTKEKGRGTGLGLSVVYGTVSRYGGQIRVDSAEGKGTRFSLLLPITDHEKALQFLQDPTETGPLSRVNILVVEDDAIIRGVIVRVLESRGYKVVAAANGSEALELVQTLETPPNLLLTDVVMPGLAGPKLAAELRIQLPHLRVLYMSGYTFEEMAEDTAPAPTEAFVAKPFSPQEICARIEQLVRA
jgi:signal transduction histidine kinase